MKTNTPTFTLGGCLVAVLWLTVPAVAGTLTGTRVIAPNAVDLTAEGTLDWTHWGLNTETDFDQKSGGGNQLSNFTQITGAVSNPVSQFGDAAVGFSWTDGVPTPNA